MTLHLRQFWQRLIGQSSRAIAMTTVAESASERVAPLPLDIAPDDPILAYFQSASGAVEIDQLDLPSPALRNLQAAGVKLVVPLVSQGELIGLLNLGPRLSRQEYSTDDRRLLSNLAAQAAPAVRVAQLVRQQQAEIQARERLEQELRVARLIQQTLLPKTEPELPGWQIKTYYQPARAVGGDFYDFYRFEDGRVGIVIGDVTDKGVPAALVMATTRSILRAAVQRFASPGQILQRVNELLCQDIPPNMFVTCLYAILEPETGRLMYANAGHTPPYRRTDSGVSELWAAGLPLGLIPATRYDEHELCLTPGDIVLFYSDGLVEAHSPRRELFGFPRLMRLVEEYRDGAGLIEFLLAKLDPFTGSDWEQEDDITLLTLQRLAAPAIKQGSDPVTDRSEATAPEDGWQVLAEFTVPSIAGNERLAMEQVVAEVRRAHDPPLTFSQARLERLKTAVAEATMNAIEHGNRYRQDMPVSIRLRTRENALAVQITDRGGGHIDFDSETPDIAAKLAGLQTPRGWGLFLIKNLVDDVRVVSDGTHHTVELIMHTEGDSDVQ